MDQHVGGGTSDSLAASAPSLGSSYMSMLSQLTDFTEQHGSSKGTHVSVGQPRLPLSSHCSGITQEAAEQCAGCVLTKLR